MRQGANPIGGTGASRPGSASRLAAPVIAVSAMLLGAPAAAGPATVPAPGGIGDLIVTVAKSAPAAKPKPADPAKPAAEGGVLTLSGWSIGGDEARTVVSFDLSRPASVRLLLIAEPTRVAIDLPAARFEPALDDPHGGRGLIGGWRFGAVSATRSRLVLDTRAAVRVARAEFDASAPPGKARLVVELVAGRREDMARAQVIDIAGPEAGETRRDPAPPAVDAAPVGRPVVVIDAGHGGGDAGTVSPATGTPEKTVVLEMAKVLVRQLRESGRYEVVATRTEDTFLGLGERVRIARARHADLFLSIHADAEYDHSVRGATIYTLAEKASDEQAAALAAKENQSDAIAGHVVEEAEPEVADILADLTIRETRRLSHAFARDLLDEYRRHGRLVKAQPHRQASLKVLRAHDVPAALVELGFLSNKEDEALLTSPDWREKTAVSLVAAIDRWFASRDAGTGVRRDVRSGAPASP